MKMRFIFVFERVCFYFMFLNNSFQFGFVIVDDKHICAVCSQMLSNYFDILIKSFIGIINFCILFIACSTVLTCFYYLDYFLEYATN